MLHLRNGDAMRHGNQRDTMRHLQGCCIARPMDTRVESLRTFQQNRKARSVGQRRLRTWSVGRILKCTCIAGYGTASQLFRFEVGHRCDFHRWKIMRSVLRRSGD
jgi:hypothetical protein